MKKLFFGPFAALMLLVFGNQPLRADYFTFTDRATFDSFSSPDYHLSFDTLASGTLLPSGSSIEEITFVYNLGGVQLVATNTFSAPSGNISIGANDGGDALQDGDAVRFDFSPRFGFGLYIIGNAVDFQDGDITLTVGSATASLNTTMVQPISLMDGGSVYFLGIRGDVNSSFGSAVLNANSGEASPAFVYNFDSIVTSITAVPEPSSLLMVIASCASLFHRRRCRTS